MNLLQLKPPMYKKGSELMSDLFSFDWNDEELLAFEDEQSYRGIEDENLSIRMGGKEYLVGRMGVLRLFEEQEELTQELIDILGENNG